MAEKAMLTLIGRQRDESGEESVTESRAAADYYQKGDSSYILYEEALDDFGDVVNNTIKCNGSMLEMTKRGKIRSRMLFEAGQTHRTDYVTPYGTLPLEVSTRKFTLSRQENGIEIRLAYTLASGGRLLSDCTLDISLRFL